MSQPSKHRIPKSRAKTAYGLLTEIENIAAVEPKRIAMRVCLLRGRYLSNYSSYDKPACQTVGCIAGWTYVLTHTANVNEFNLADTDHAGTILGLTCEQQQELFYPNLTCDKDQQTRSHAHAVIKHIRAFKAKYSRQLRAHRLPEVKTNV